MHFALPLSFGTSQRCVQLAPIVSSVVTIYVVLGPRLCSIERKNKRGRSLLSRIKTFICFNVVILDRFELKIPGMNLLSQPIMLPFGLRRIMINNMILIVRLGSLSYILVSGSQRFQKMWNVKSSVWSNTSLQKYSGNKNHISDSEILIKELSLRYVTFSISLLKLPVTTLFQPVIKEN